MFVLTESAVECVIPSVHRKRCIEDLISRYGHPYGEDLLELRVFSLDRVGSKLFPCKLVEPDYISLVVRLHRLP